MHAIRKHGVSYYYCYSPIIFDLILCKFALLESPGVPRPLGTRGSHGVPDTRDSMIDAQNDIRFLQGWDNRKAGGGWVEGGTSSRSSKYGGGWTDVPRPLLRPLRRLPRLLILIPPCFFF